MRWQDQKQNFVGNVNWYQEAQNRNSWKKLENAFSSTVDRKWLMMMMIQSEEGQFAK